MPEEFVRQPNKISLLESTHRDQVSYYKYSVQDFAAVHFIIILFSFSSLFLLRTSASLFPRKTWLELIVLLQHARDTVYVEYVTHQRREDARGDY